MRCEGEGDAGRIPVTRFSAKNGTQNAPCSEGGAYAHNLFAGRIVMHPELSRETPFHPAHSTAVAGLRNIVGGGDRFQLLTQKLIDSKTETKRKALKEELAKLTFG